MSAVNLLSSFDVSDGVSQGEIDLVYDLMNSNLISAEEVSQATGIPSSEIQSVYDSIKATESSTPLNYPSSGNIFSGTGLLPIRSSFDTTPIGGFDFGAGERGFDPRGDIFAPPGSGSYISDFDRDLDIQDERERLADLQEAADYLKELGEAELARQAQFNADRLAAEQAARQAEAAANSPEAAETQAKDDDFDTKVNAAGGVTPGTIDKVIEIALEVYGDNSRGVVKVISESLKGGLTMKDLEDATDLSGDEIMAAAKTAANDPNKSLTPGEILNGAANTVYDTTNKIVDIVEKGLEVTGIEKVIDTIGNTVSKIVGLDPNQTQKVLVVNPVTGQVTVQASNVPGGGIIGNLPQSPYVPIGSTSGGTTYGIDAENAILNVVLGKIITNGGLDQGDTKSVIAAGVEEVTGIPMEVAGNVIDAAGAVIDETGKLIDNSGILNVGDNNTGTTLTIDGAGNTGAGDTAFENIMGPIDTRTDAEKAADAQEAANRTYTSVGSSTQDLLDLIANSGTKVCPDGTKLAGQTVDINTDCGTLGGKTKVCPDNTKLAGQTVDINTDCGTLGGKTKVCPDGTKLAGQTVDINTDCGTLGGKTKVCPDNTKLAGQTVDINTDCGTLGGKTKVCPDGTKLAGQTVDINTDCGTLGGKTKVCPDGTKLAGQTVDINTDCGTLGGKTKVCPDGTKLAGQTVDINTDCGTLGGKTKVCPDGTKLAGQTVDINTDCGTLGGKTKVCPDGTKLAGQTVDINTDCGTLGGKTKVCPDGTKLAGQTVDINTDCGTLGGKTKVCPDNTKLAGQTVDINTDCGTLGGKTKVCPDGTKLAGQTVDINTDCGTLGGKTKVCPDGTKLAGQTVDINTDCGTLGGKTKVCPDNTKLAGQTVDINTDCGIITDPKVCPAGQTLNPVTNECEYAKVICGKGYTLNILTGQCEKDTDEEDTEGGILTLPTPNLKVPGRGDFVTADDVLVKNLGDVGGIYSILPAPVREPFLADRRQQDIRNVADTVGIRQGQDFNQDPFAVERFARYANAFDVGTPELLDISGVLPGDFPAYEEKFNVQFPEFGIAPPVRPDEDLFPIAGARFDPTTYTPTAMAAGGVVEKENGIESLMDRRQQAVNRMLIKRAGSYFGR
jgi:hypothetical protein